MRNEGVNERMWNDEEKKNVIKMAYIDCIGESSYSQPKFSAKIRKLDFLYVQ